MRVRDLLLLLQLARREVRARPEVVVALDEREPDHRDDDRPGERPQPSGAATAQHEQTRRRARASAARVCVQSSAAKRSSASGGPKRLRIGTKKQRDDEQVRRGERREERRGEPPEDDAAARVVDEVLRQAGEAGVVEPELVGEPAAPRARQNESGTA